MAFSCPGCNGDVPRSPEAWAVRCPSCGGVIRARPLDADLGALRVYEVEVAGRPETRKRIEVPWSEDDTRRLRAWLAWSTVLTLGLVGVLYLLARLG